MNMEIPIYAYLDKVYLFETEKYFYNHLTGEVFFLGERIDKVIEKYRFKDVVYSIYSGGLGKIEDDKLPNSLRFLIEDDRIKKALESETLDKLLLINMYNQYDSIHNIYISMRLSNIGLVTSTEMTFRVGRRLLCRRYIEYRRWILDPSYTVKSNITWRGPRNKLPLWQELTRKIIGEYIKEIYPDHYEKFKFLDKRYREHVREKGYSDFEFYQFILSEISDIEIDDIIILPKIIMSELIYLEYINLSGKNIILTPLYKGVLRQR